MLDIYIGYDPHEAVAYHVLCHSILERATCPVRFMPLRLGNLGRRMWRERHPLQSTDFSFSRFLVPSLSGFSGWSLFMDCDFMARADLAELLALADDRYAVMVCQHEYVPKTERKFLDQVQTPYGRKNWSSLMLFNNARCRALSEDYVNTATGLELHQFKWLADDGLIGALPLDWNWLVGEYDYRADARMVHFTLGGPYFPEYLDCDYAGEWLAARERMGFAGKGG
jgi:hypothetical protein